jgi:hypothetical protein
MTWYQITYYQITFYLITLSTDNIMLSDNMLTDFFSRKRTPFRSRTVTNMFVLGILPNSELKSYRWSYRLMILSSVLSFYVVTWCCYLTLFRLCCHLARHITLLSRSDIFRVQTRRVSQTIVFRYREIGGRLSKYVNIQVVPSGNGKGVSNISSLVW